MHDLVGPSYKLGIQMGLGSKCLQQGYQIFLSLLTLMGVFKCFRVQVFFK